jgi:hypothetical protein
MVSFHIDKTNNYFFQKINSLLNFEIILFSMIYYDIVLWVMKLFKSVKNHNYDEFQHVDFMFSQNFISLFWGLFDDKTDLRVRYLVSPWKSIL